MAGCWALLLAGCLGGCRSAGRTYKPAVLVSHSDAEKFVHDALYHEDADIRRGAIEQLVRTRFADTPAAVDAYAVVARTDTSASVRCAAVQALGRHGGDGAISTIIVMLTDLPGDRGVRPAGARVRWEAMQVLEKRMRDHTINNAARPTVRDVAMERLASDGSRDVRIAAASLLGHEPVAESIGALIAALRTSDFGVVYQAERSLMRLTGVQNGHDANAWFQWLESTPDPFARRGALNDTLDRPAKKSWRLWSERGEPRFRNIA